MANNPHRVLVVERGQLAQEVERYGFVCETTGNGSAALLMLKSQPFDVVVGDLSIPDDAGRSFCLELLQNGGAPPTVVVTEPVPEKIVEALRARGAAEVVFKPVDASALAATIQRLLQSGSAAEKRGSRDKRQPAAVHPAEAAEIDTETADAESGKSEAKRIVAVLIQDQQRLADLTARLAAVGTHAVSVNGSEELLRQLNQNRIDLVIIENDLGGFLTGLEIVKRLTEELIRPETILLAEPNDRMKQKASELGIQRVLDPRIDLDKLVATVELATSEGSRSSPIPESARRMVQDFAGIPPLPQLVLKVTRYLSMDVADIPVKELANDISFDPKAISELLKLTNSSAMGLRRKINKVSEAVTLLGPKRTISLIISSATIAAQSQLLKGWSPDLRKWYYKRSVLAASTASIFAEVMEQVSADSAFVLGLLQDVGMLVMASSFGEKYTVVVERSCEAGQLRMHQLEEKEFKLSHPAVSAALLQKWKFPQSLIGPILEHHNPDASGARSQLELSLMHAMRIGEAVADLSDVAHPLRRQALNKLLDKYGAERAGECMKCLRDSIAKSAESCKLFSLPTPKQEEMQQLMEAIESAEAVAV